MERPFTRIGLFAKPKDDEVKSTFIRLVSFLHQEGYSLFVESYSARLLESKKKIKVKDKKDIASSCDLIIVVGGDGSLLNTARSIVDDRVPVVGINRGRLGFLADISPEQLEHTLTPILAGDFEEEERSLLHASVVRGEKQIAEKTALNDVVMFSGTIARMIEFEIFIDNHFVLQQRSDGIIAATPTGSTAYALSGGGPILYPTIDAFCLVPMFPHTLTNRPIVVKSSSSIKIIISEKEITPTISFDGQEHISLKPRDEIIIKQHKHTVRLLHPKGYNYFGVLREKLGWNVSKTSDRYPKNF